MRKFILGITCLIAALVLGIIAWAVCATVNWSRLDHFVFFGIVGVLALCSIGLAAVALFAIAKRGTNWPNTIKAFVTASVLAAILLSGVLLFYVSTHSMTSLEMAQEATHQIHLAIMPMAGSAEADHCQTGAHPPTRELSPLTSTRVEKLFYGNMDRIKIPVQTAQTGVDFLLSRMNECDRDQNNGYGTINRALLREGCNLDREIRLLTKEYTYRTLLDEICAQTDLYWWVEDNPWTCITVGPKSVYEEHKKAARSKL